MGMAMELRRLHYFIAVAEEGNVTRAAERLGMQQPPLSLQIKSMERELAIQLFRRKPRGVELTDAGRALLAEAKLTLAHLDRALETARRTARGEQGRLCVGIAPTAPFHPVVPQAIRAFRQTHPLVSLTIEEGLNNEELLIKQQIDVAFVRGASVQTANYTDQLVVAALLEEPLMVALSRRHPRARTKRQAAIELKNLHAEPFILFGRPGTSLHSSIIAACRTAGFSPRVAQLAPRISTTLSLVAVGLGIALVPESIQNIRMDGVVYRHLKGTQQKAFLGLASRRNDPSAVVKRFLTLVKQVAKP